MDDGKGHFVPVEIKKTQDVQQELAKLKHKHPDYGGLYYIGQNLEFNDSKFRVISFTKNTITLKLLPK